MATQEDNNSAKEGKFQDIYVDRFLTSPVYVTVFIKTIATASTSFVIARVMSIILFSLGVALLVCAVIVGFRNNEILSLIFSGAGTISIISLLLYRPIERIQSGVNELIKSQIACLSFQAQFDSIYRTLATWSEMPLDETSREEQLKFAHFLREAATELISDLNQIKNPKSN